jgi:hypothetical protein
MESIEGRLNAMREMTTKDIAKKYGYSLSKASNLSSAIKYEERFKKLADTKIRTEDVAKELKISFSTAASYRSALVREGLAETQVESHIQSILYFVKNKPSTNSEISKGTGIDDNPLNYSLDVMYKNELIDRFILKASMIRPRGLGNGWCGPNCKTTFNFLPEDQDVLGHRLASYIPADISSYEKGVILRRLAEAAPPVTFETVRNYLIPSRR